MSSLELGGNSYHKDFLSHKLKTINYTRHPPSVQSDLKRLIAVCVRRSHTGDLKPANNCSMDLQTPKLAGQTFSNSKARAVHMDDCTTSARKIIISMSDILIFYIYT